VERLKNMELKKTFLVLSASCVLVALLMLGLVFMICNSISSNFPSGGIEILADGSIVKMETPTETQQNILSMLGIIQIVSCIVLPMGGLALSGILYYHIKLKQPISTLRNGISRIRNHDLDFSMPVHSDDELGQLCTAFDTMREELLKSNQELWRQAEERKRLNAAFSHDLRNPITVLKGTIKLLRQGTADEQAIDRLESYTLRIEQYAEAMSSIQRLEQMPVRINEYSYSLLHSELEETAKILAGALEPSVSAPDKGTREANIKEITEKLEEAFADNEEWLAVLGEAIYQYQKKTVRKMILKDHKRPDGRALDQIRPLAAEVPSLI
jgi:signal transduction histidine kinase